MLSRSGFYKSHDGGEALSSFVRSPRRDRRQRQGLSSHRNSLLVILHLKLALTNTTYGTDPAALDIIKECPGSNTATWVTLLRDVNISTYDTSEPCHSTPSLFDSITLYTDNSLATRSFADRTLEKNSMTAKANQTHNMQPVSKW